jgi:hypothetical protein
MLILFDHGTPRSVARWLQDHTVVEAMARGWDQLSNGELLKAAEEAGFDVLLTTDKNIRYQQNLKGRRLAIVVLGNPPLNAALIGLLRQSARRRQAAISK